MHYKTLANIGSDFNPDNPTAEIENYMEAFREESDPLESEYVEFFSEYTFDEYAEEFNLDKSDVDAVIAHAEDTENYDYYEGNFGHWDNPRGFYDWCVIGGRFAETLLAKKTCTTCIESKHEEGDYHTEPPAGFKWVSACRYEDIEFDAMLEFGRQNTKKLYYAAKRFFETGERDDKVLSYDYPVDENGVRNDFGYHSEYMYIKGETLAENIARGKFANTETFKDNLAYGFVDPNDECYNDGYGCNQFWNQSKPDDMIAIIDAHN